MGKGHFVFLKLIQTEQASETKEAGTKYFTRVDLSRHRFQK